MTEPKTPKERLRIYRERQNALGRKQSIFYLTDIEHEYLKVVLEMVREDELSLMKKPFAAIRGETQEMKK